MFFESNGRSKKGIVSQLKMSGALGKADQKEYFKSLMLDFRPYRKAPDYKYCSYAPIRAYTKDHITGQ